MDGWHSTLLEFQVRSTTIGGNNCDTVNSNEVPESAECSEPLPSTPISIQKRVQTIFHNECLTASRGTPTMKRPSMMDRKAAATHSLDNTPVVAAIREQFMQSPHSQSVLEALSTVAKSNTLSNARMPRRDRDASPSNGISLPRVSTSTDLLNMAVPASTSEILAMDALHLSTVDGEFSSNAYLEGIGGRKRGRADSEAAENNDCDKLIPSMANEKTIESRGQRPRTASNGVKCGFPGQVENRTRAGLAG
ncbi:hypothetical protein BJ138DRAFT_1141229 [Hygrophoropsis aurantiaca]|uniref:Uncharacterized protein n=1 Tax=Hygrophoropsis aurantiaca TaxID=72124 RepID=A0ACB8ARL5_9AGAM|nr:hypothetical protein BJ138DRAFT_1141229 [Hygrophoropsis aurantiaca]